MIAEGEICIIAARSKSYGNGWRIAHGIPRMNSRVIVSEAELLAHFQGWFAGGVFAALRALSHLEVEALNRRQTFSPKVRVVWR